MLSIGPMRALPALLSLLVPAVLVTASSSPAKAYEHQWHVGGGLGYTLLAPGATFPVTTTQHGASASAHLTYGLTDAFNLMGELDGGYYPGALPVARAGASVGVGYVIDVLRWVPYVGLMAGGSGLFVMGDCGARGEATCGGPRLGVSIPFGLDYQFSRSFAVGFAGKYGVLLLGPEGVDQAFSGTIRAEYIWGF